MFLFSGPSHKQVVSTSEPYLPSDMPLYFMDKYELVINHTSTSQISKEKATRETIHRIYHNLLFSVGKSVAVTHSRITILVNINDTRLGSIRINEVVRIILGRRRL